MMMSGPMPMKLPAGEDAMRRNMDMCILDKPTLSQHSQSLLWDFQLPIQQHSALEQSSSNGTTAPQPCPPPAPYRGKKEW